jgi:hypothetical protein
MACLHSTLKQNHEESGGGISASIKDKHYKKNLCTNVTNIFLFLTDNSFVTKGSNFYCPMQSCQQEISA